MSKQDKAKKLQNYVTENLKKCATCAHLKKETDVTIGVFGVYKQDKKVRCGIGGFKVKKLGVCDLWVSGLPSGSEK